MHPDPLPGQMSLPYKHPSNTLTTIPRAIRRLTRSGRSTVQQIERFLLKAGVKGTAYNNRCCVVAEWLTNLGFRVSVTREYIRDLDTEDADGNGVCLPIPACLTKFTAQFDAHMLDKRLYTQEYQCVQSKS